MRHTRALLALTLLLFAPSPAFAQVHTAWGDCNATDPSNENWSAGDHVLTIYVTGVGGDFQGGSFRLVVADRCYQEGRYLPQAWRFDAAGCQAGMLRVEYPASATGCATLGPRGVSFESVTAEIEREFLTPRDTLQYPALVVRAGGTFQPTHLDPSGSYVLARIHFDMTNTVADADPAGVLCGCGASPRGLWVTNATLTTTDGYDMPLYTVNVASWNMYFPCIIDPFARKGAFAVATLAADPSCMTTAAHARSWGGVKAMYRAPAR
jgi:hypothetical protein